MALDVTPNEYINSMLREMKKRGARHADKDYIENALSRVLIACDIVPEVATKFVMLRCKYCDKPFFYRGDSDDEWQYCSEECIQEMLEGKKHVASVMDNIIKDMIAPKTQL